jgi:CRISPR system Cascade subunit CasB
MTEINSLIKYLNEHREDKAMMASLRRGLRLKGGLAPEVSRVIQSRLAADAPPWLESAYYLVAPLFAFHNQEGGNGNMGDHFRALCDPGEEIASNIERRFMVLLSSGPDEINDSLRQAISLLKSKQVPVNWNELMQNMIDWKYPNSERRDRVQKEWARKFWRTRQSENIPSTKSTDSNEPN